MKKIFILIFMAFSVLASGTTYYISPGGNDSNSGTSDSPFFTLNKAWSMVKAGDIIYARGGVYKYNTRQNLIGKTGTASDTIRIMAYQNERPVFTKSSSFVGSGWPTSLIYVVSDYVHIKGIEIAYFKQASSAIWYGLAAFHSNHCKFEQIRSHHNGHGMVLRDDSNHNLILNCDFHHNFDPLTSGDPYGNADGLEVGYMSSSMENTIRGCRIWNNSDDGIDLWNNNGNVVIDNCWAWMNGFAEDGVTRGGDGGGFKLGSTTTEAGTEFKRTLKNCVSTYNRTRGYNQNDAKVRHYFYNNISYKNPVGIVFYSYNLANVFKNNVVFASGSENWQGDFSNSTLDHNSYDSRVSPNGPVASAADYLSVDTTGLSKARQANGALPSISFLKLAAGSDLIDAGINIGTPYLGNAPDLGPFESGSVAPAPVTALAYVSASVKDATASQVDALYNVTLSTVIPVPSAFEVKVNSVVKTISSLTISDKTLSIKLSEPVKYGDVVTLAYTKPAINPLKSAEGSIAISMTAQPVTNSVQGIAPVYTGAAIQAASPDKIEVSYDINLAGVLPAATAFTTKVNRQSRAVQSLTISGNKVVLAFSTAFVNTDTVLISYTKPATNPLQSTTGVQAAGFTDKTVTNYVAAVIPTPTTDPIITDSKISIYPNPAHDFVKIANFNPGNKVSSLKILDFDGKMIEEINLANFIKTGKIPITVSPGVYISQILMDGVIQYVQKLMVVK